MFDLGNFLKKKWDTSVVRDAVSSNTAADQQRRQVAAQKAAPVQTRPNIPYYGSFSPQVTNQEQAVQQTGRDLGRMQREGQITGQQFNDKFSQLLASTTKDSNYKTPIAQAGNFAKSIVKPFWETGDTVVKGAQLGVANATNNTQAADNARLRRDQSYQDSIVKPVAQAGRMVADTPVGYLIPGNSARKSAEKQNENKLIELRDNTEILTQTKAKEIQDGIRAGVYDPQKAQTAIQELLAVNESANAQLGQFYDDKLASQGLNKDMTAAQAYATAFGNLASTAGLLISPASGTAIKQAGGNVIKRGISELGTNSALNALGGASSAYGQGADFTESLKAGATQAGIGAVMMGAGYLKGLKGPAAVETNIPAAPGSLRESIQAAKQNVRLAINNPDGANVFKINNPLDAKTTGLDINNPMGAQTKPLDVRNPLGAETGKKLSIVDRYKQATDIDAPKQDGFVRNPLANDAPQVGKTPLKTETKNNKVYHGSSVGSSETGDRYGKGFYVTTDKNRAGEYANGGAVDEYSLDGTKLANLDDKIDNKIVDTLKKEISDLRKNGDDYYKDVLRLSGDEKTFPKADIDSARKFYEQKIATAKKLGLDEDSMPTFSKDKNGDFTVSFIDETLESLKNIDGNRLFRSLPSPTAQSLFTSAGYDGVSYRGMGGDTESVIYSGNLKKSATQSQPPKSPLANDPLESLKQEAVPSRLTNRKQNIELQIQKLESKFESDGSVPGVYVTGRDGVSARRFKQIGRQLESTIDDAVKLKKLRNDLYKVEFSIQRAESRVSKPKVIKKETVVSDAKNIKVSSTDSLMLEDYGFMGDKKTQLDKYTEYLRAGGEPKRGLERINKQFDQLTNKMDEKVGVSPTMPAPRRGVSASELDGTPRLPFTSGDKVISRNPIISQIATQSQPPKSPLTVEKKPFTPISQPVDNIPAIAKRVTASDSTGQLRSAADKNLVRLSKQEQLPPQISRTEVQAKSSQSLQNDSLANGTTKVKLNTNRLKVGEEAMARLDKDTQETITKMSNQDIQRVAKDAGIDTRTYTDEQVRTKIAEQLNVRQDAVRLQNEADAAFKAGDFKTAEEKLSRSAAMGRVSREQGTDLARQLQARRIIANELDTPQQRMFKLLDTAGVNPEVYTKRLARVDFTNPQDVVKAYRELVPPKASEWLDTVRYNSMLSSPLTHLVNAASNAINIGVIAPLEKTLRGVADATGGLFGKERKYAAGEGAAYAKGSASNIKKAAGEFLDVMRGIDRTQNLDLQEYSTPLAIGGVKGATYQTLSFPMKMLGASDKFFRTLAEGGETAALNLRESKGIKLGGNKRALAEAEGAYRLYQQDTNLKGQGGVLQSIDSVTNSIMKLRKDHTWARFVFPFVKTPTNILKQGVEFSPLGFANAVTAADKTTALTRAAIGTAVFGASAAALGAGDLTWGTPTNKEARDRFLAEGKQPYAIRIGGKWVSFAKLPPAVSFPLALTAGIDDAIKQKKMSESTADAIMEGVAKWGQFLGDQSYVKNIGDTLAAFKGDADRATQAVANYPQQVVPFRALTGWIARMTDDTERKVDADKGQIEKQVQSLLLNYPGLRQKIGTRDYRGRPIPANNPVLNSFSPFKITDQRAPNAVDAELDATKAAPKTSALTPKQTSEIEKLAKAKTNEYQNQLIQSDEYKALSSDDKRKRLASLAEDVKAVESRKYQNKYSIGERALDFTGKETVLTKNQVALLQNSDLSAYKSSTSTPKTKVQSDYEVASSNRDLTMTRAKANNDLNAWNTAAAEEYDALGQQIKALDPKTDQVKINTLIKKQEALQRTALGYKANGYIKKTTTKKTGKGSKGGKFTIPTTSVASSARTSTFTNLNRLLAGTTKTNSNKGKIGNKVALRKITVKGKS